MLIDQTGTRSTIRKSSQHTVILKGSCPRDKRDTKLYKILLPFTLFVRTGRLDQQFRLRLLQHIALLKTDIQKPISTVNMGTTESPGKSPQEIGFFYVNLLNEELLLSPLVGPMNTDG